MKKFILLLSALTLASCTPSYTDVKEEFSLPKELSDCNVIKLSNHMGSKYTVFRCPLADTTTISPGKSKKTITVSEYYPKQDYSNFDNQIFELTSSLSEEQKNS